MRLREALDGVPDHRRSQGRRYPLGAILGLALSAATPLTSLKPLPWEGFSPTSREDEKALDPRDKLTRVHRKFAPFLCAFWPGLVLTEFDIVRQQQLKLRSSAVKLHCWASAHYFHLPPERR